MIFNSDWDAVGLSPLESIQHGIPTFTSVLNGGLKELLVNEFSYFIQNEHNIDLLVEKFQYSIDNYDQIKKLTLDLRNHINEVSSPRKIAAEVMDTYQ